MTLLALRVPRTQVLTFHFRGRQEGTEDLDVLTQQDNLLYCAVMNTALEERTDLGVATARFFRVLSDPTRLAILERLLEGPHTVSELVEYLECPQSRVSNHLACLRWCEFVETERLGRQVTYRVKEDRVRAILEVAHATVAEHCEHLMSCTRVGPSWI